MPLVNLNFDNDSQLRLFDGVDFDGRKVSYAVKKRNLELMGERGQTVKIAQLFKIVEPGLLTCIDFFEGLKRPCKADHDMNGDEKKRVLILHPSKDYDWPNSKRFDGEDGLNELPPPPGKVFFVIVSPNEGEKKHPSVDFWLDHWGWVEADRSRPNFPKDYLQRYEKRLELPVNTK